MKKVLLISILAILSLSWVYADGIYGLRAGMNISNFTGDDASTDSKLGFHAGLMMQYPLHDLVLLQPELLYTQRGGEKTVAKIDYITTLHYAELPIFVKANLGVGNFKVQPYLGPEFRYLVKGNYTVKSKNNTNTSKIKNINDFDMGLGLGADLVFKNFLVGARYSMGLTKTYEKPSIGKQADIKNESILINVGVLY